MIRSFRFAALAGAILLTAQAPAPVPTPSEIVDKAPAADWVAIAASDLLVMDLAPDAAGRARRVVIQLMPAPFSQGWVGNIRKLAAAHWWDGTSVNRVQDNYVAQWGDANGEDKAKAKPLPAGLVKVREGEYVSRIASDALWRRVEGKTGTDASLFPVMNIDSYLSPVSGLVGWVQGWPVGTEGPAGSVTNAVWPVHCYGMVGVGRDLSPDTGSGAELYTVIGHAPRHLDRNIALVGRVITGIEHLSSLPRGTEALGFYKTAAERTPILRVRLASELPAGEQPRFEYLSTESGSFARYAEARANRKDAFFIRPAGGADVCNVPVPVRAARVQK